MLGQEYTDFDKGLEEGIEGSIFGFNLLLKSAFEDESSPSIVSIGYAPSILTMRSPPYGTRFPTRIIFKITRKDYTVEEDDKEEEEEEGGTTRRRLLLIDDRRTNRLIRLVNNTANRSLPIGQELVKLSYVRCELGKGSPQIGGSLMLISWSRTPVRIFGGAILKNARMDCGNF